MNNNRPVWSGILIALLCLAASPRGLAQDELPDPPTSHNRVADTDSLMLYSGRQDTVPLPYVDVPSLFQATAPNTIDDPFAVLDPFIERLRLSRLRVLGDTVRIVHVGDSHVRGHIYPQSAGEVVRAAFPGVTYVDLGVNGASSITFTRNNYPARIAALRPDLIILSFGTNESHDRRYSPTEHVRQMSALLTALRDRLPDVPILLTTPPGSYDSTRRGRRSRTYTVNPRTARAVETIHRFARQNRLAVWDLYRVCGGASRACLNWQEAELMRPDHVHYLPEGYVLQGQLLGQALLRTYNDKMKSLQ